MAHSIEGIPGDETGHENKHQTGHENRHETGHENRHETGHENRHEAGKKASRKNSDGTGRVAGHANGSGQAEAETGRTHPTGSVQTGHDESSAELAENELAEKLFRVGQRDYTRLDLADLAQITRTPLDEIRSHFRSTDEWIDACYCHMVDQYRLMTGAIPDFEEYTAGEKLLNFFLTSMDMMRDQEPFVRSTYHPFILDRFTSTRFEHSVARLFRQFTESDNRIALSHQLLLVSPVYTWWSREYLHMTGYWLTHPDSEPEVMALAEKTVNLLNEILYNGVIDNTLDLGKYLVQNGFVSVWTPVSVLRRFLRF